MMVKTLRYKKDLQKDNVLFVWDEEELTVMGYPELDAISKIDDLKDIEATLSGLIVLSIH